MAGLRAFLERPGSPALVIPLKAPDEEVYI